MSFSNILKGIGGEIEIGRTMLASSGVAAITTPIIFEAVSMAHNGWTFDVTAWCIAYPGGLTALGGLGVFAIGKKDKAIAEARATQASTNVTNADADATRANTAERTGGS